MSRPELSPSARPPATLVVAPCTSDESLVAPEASSAPAPSGRSLSPNAIVARLPQFGGGAPLYLAQASIHAGTSGLLFLDAGFDRSAAHVAIDAQHGPMVRSAWTRRSRWSSREGVETPTRTGSIGGRQASNADRRWTSSASFTLFSWVRPLRAVRVPCAACGRRPTRRAWLVSRYSIWRLMLRRSSSSELFGGQRSDARLPVMFGRRFEAGRPTCLSMAERGDGGHPAPTRARNRPVPIVKRRLPRAAQSSRRLLWGRHRLWSLFSYLHALS